MPLTPANRRSFHEHGYLILDPAVPPDTLDAVLQQVEPLYPGHSVGKGFAQPTRTTNAWKSCPAVHELAVWPTVLDALHYIYGRHPRPFQTLNFPVSTEQSVHADTVHFNTLPGGWMCGVWVALEDIHPDSGPLVYYPGSNQLPESILEPPNEVHPEGLKGWLKYHWHRSMVRLGRRPNHQDYHKYEVDAARRLDEFGFKPQFGLLKRGQALIWAANLLHGGSARKNPDLTRHSQVTHYFFEGVQSFVPVFSRGKRLHWTAPDYLPLARRLAA